jgi:hypothetical protein
MSRMIDQIRASKLPSNMMQFAARGALSVPPAENIEILVYLAKHNKVFGDLARMTLAGWDEKASLAAASDSQTPREVLEYFIDNLRPKLLPALLENPSVRDEALAKFAISASRESIEAMLRSTRIRQSGSILDCLRSNPYLNKNESDEIAKVASSTTDLDGTQANHEVTAKQDQETGTPEDLAEGDVPHEIISAYLSEHAGEIAAEADKPFQPIGSILDAADPGSSSEGTNTGSPPLSPEQSGVAVQASASAATSAAVAPALQSKPTVAVKKLPQVEVKRDNTVQKINRLDIKGRIQLALKGNKEERSLLIRDGTKVVALAVLEAPKLSDGEVEKFAGQKNVLESVLRAIPLKRRFMKNYGVVRNLVANPRTPIDLSLGLMKHLLTQDLKNLSANKEVSDTIRKLALKMFKQKLQTANKK